MTRKSCVSGSLLCLLLLTSSSVERSRASRSCFIACLGSNATTQHAQHSSFRRTRSGGLARSKRHPDPDTSGACCMTAAGGDDSISCASASKWKSALGVLRRMRGGVSSQKFTASRLSSTASSALPLPAAAAAQAGGHDRAQVPEERANWFSKLTFAWANELMATGNRKVLEEDDLWDRSKSKDRVSVQTDAFEIAYENAVNVDYKKPALLPEELGVPVIRALWTLYQKEFLRTGALRFLNTCVQLFPAMLLSRLLKSIEAFAVPGSATAEIARKAYMTCLALFGIVCLKTVVENQFFYAQSNLGLNVKGVLSNAVYRKSLRLSPAARQSSTVGEIVNYMQLDASRLETLSTSVHTMWDSMFQIMAFTALLLTVLGPSILAGFSIMLALIPVNLMFFNRLSAYRKQLLGFTDKRVKLINEILQGIRAIKFYNWESPFKKEVEGIHNSELNILLRSVTLRSALVAILSTTPAVVIVVTLGLYSAMGNALTAAKVFTSLSLFNQLRLPLYFFPVTLSTFADGKVSIKRLNDFFNAEEVVPYVQRVNGRPGSPRHHAPNIAAKVEDGAFFWTNRSVGANGERAMSSSSGSAVTEAGAAEGVDVGGGSGSEGVAGGVVQATDGRGPGEGAMELAPDASGVVVRQPVSPSLHGINFEVKKGELVAIVGSVGVGKSSLLSALLGEMRLISGSVYVEGSLAYVPQSSWIPNDTLRGNVCFGKPYDEEKYRAVIKACRLERDIELLSDGDMTEIGEQGINLSGGQKQRLSIARALYADADVYLFDDPLSALDAQVGKGVFDDCIQGALNKRTRILVTNQLQFLPQVDRIIVMGELNGVAGSTIVDQGSYAELLARGRDLTTLVKQERTGGAVADDVSEAGVPTGKRVLQTVGEAAVHSASSGSDSNASSAGVGGSGSSGGERKALKGHADGFSGYDVAPHEDLVVDHHHTGGYDSTGAALTSHSAGSILKHHDSDQHSGSRSSSSNSGSSSDSAHAGDSGNGHLNGNSVLGSGKMNERDHIHSAAAAAPATVHAEQEEEQEDEVTERTPLLSAGHHSDNDRAISGAVSGGSDRIEVPAEAAAMAADREAWTAANCPPLEGEAARSRPLDETATASATSTLTASEVKSKDAGGRAMEQKDKQAKSLMTAEERAKGAVGWPVYRKYFASAKSPMLLVSLVVLFLVSNMSVQGQQWIVSLWTSDPTYARYPLSLYLGAVAAAAGVVGLFSHLRTMMAYILSIRVSRTLHGDLLNSVLHAPVAFFDTTPVGRTVQRFSRDTDQIDQQLISQLAMMINGIMQMIGGIGAIALATPLFLVGVGPLAIIYFGRMNFFRPVARELKRLDSLTRSPLYAHFGETLGGLPAIRAFGDMNRFARTNEKLVDNNLSTYFALKVADRWLSFRLEILGNFVVLSACLLAVLSASKGQLGAGLAGLSITNALAVTGLLNWAVRCYTETETMMNSVERVLYTSHSTPQEAPHHMNRPKHPYYHRLAELAGPALADDASADESVARCPDDGLLMQTGWPWEGRIHFGQVTMRYRPGTDLVLKGVDLDIRPGEKIGIVGRTGSGKSSLLQVLFRMVEVENGKICIDGVDTSKVGLSALRRRLTIIPQEPVLFSGTVRSNLDPFDAYTDEEVWSALRRASLGPLVQYSLGGLEGTVAEYGANFSVGQRQLLCLARALLRKTRILVLDEATSSVDVDTDALIQKTIRRSFADCTVLTIAHRLNTIMDSDRILVMDGGRVSEFDTPDALLKDPESDFYQLLSAERQTKTSLANATPPSRPREEVVVAHAGEHGVIGRLHDGLLRAAHVDGVEGRRTRG